MWNKKEVKEDVVPNPCNDLVLSRDVLQQTIKSLKVLRDEKMSVIKNKKDVIKWMLEKIKEINNQIIVLEEEMSRLGVTVDKFDARMQQIVMDMNGEIVAEGDRE